MLGSALLEVTDAEAKLKSLHPAAIPSGAALQATTGSFDYSTEDVEQALRPLTRAAVHAHLDCAHNT